jgi:hypothetical protein
MVQALIKGWSNLFQDSAAQAKASPDTDEEAIWRAEFDEAGEIEVRDNLSLDNYEPRRQFAFRWLREQVKANRRREQQMHRYVRLTFWAAVGAVVLGIFSLWRS